MRRFSGWVTLIGYLILIPAEFMFVLVLMVIAGTATAFAMGAGLNAECFSVVALVGGIWGYPILFTILMAIAVGSLLIDHRKVLLCDNCGAVVPRQ